MYAVMCKFGQINVFQPNFLGTLFNQFENYGNFICNDYKRPFSHRNLVSAIILGSRRNYKENPRQQSVHIFTDFLCKYTYNFYRFHKKYSLR